jgi:DNA gyrase subunit A
MTPDPSRLIGSTAPIDLLDGCSPVVRRLLHVVHELVDEPHEATDAKTAIALYCTRDLGLDPQDVDDACDELAAHTQRLYPPGTVGDAYRALLRLAQPWQTRYPLLETSGIIGDHHDDDPAGPEQVGVRISHLAHTLLPLDRAPLLPIGLLNGGADGDAVVPPHNLSELWTALEHVRQDPDESLDDLMEVLPGPDFPTGGVIWGTGSVRELYATGAASLVVRASIEDELQGSRTRVSIAGLPPGVLIKTVATQIRDLVRRGRFPLIQLEDLSTETRVRVVVDAPRTVTTEDLKTLLFEETACQRIVPCRLAFHAEGGAVARPLRDWLAEAAARCTPAWRPKAGPILDRVPPLREIMERGGYESPLFDLVDQRRTKILMA